MQLNPIQRRTDNLPQTLGHTHHTAEEPPSFLDRLMGFNSTNWIVDLPDSLTQMRDFHYAVSASFRATQSIGDEYLLDEVQ